MTTTHDFPQADRLELVGELARVVALGHRTDAALEAQLGLSSDGRQARYYRQAATTLGLVRGTGVSTALTVSGQDFAALASDEARARFLASRVFGMPVFTDALRFIARTAPDEVAFRNWFATVYPGSPETARRRFSTLLGWLRSAGFVEVANGVLQATAFAAPAAPSIAEEIQAGRLVEPQVAVVEIDLQRAERARSGHRALVNAVAETLLHRGHAPREENLVDLSAASDAGCVLFEMKTLARDADSARSQLRKAFAQLSEYRFVTARPNAALCVVVDRRLDTSEAWRAALLENDLAVAFAGRRQNGGFDLAPRSRALLGAFNIG